MVHSVELSKRQARAAHTPLTSGFSEDLQGLGVHLPSASGLWAQGLPLHQVHVRAKLHEQAHEGRLTAMTQDSIQDAAGGAPVEALRVDRAVAVEVGVRPRPEEQPEALQVVVGGADVQGANYQGGEAPRERGLGVRRHVVVDVNISAVPTGRHRDGQTCGGLMAPPGAHNTLGMGSHDHHGLRTSSWLTCNPRTKFLKEFFQTFKHLLMPRLLKQLKEGKLPNSPYEISNPKT